MKQWNLSGPVRQLVRALPLAAVLLVAQPLAGAQAVSADAVARHYASGVQAAYDDALAASLDLQKAVQAFAAAPSPAGLKAARKAWLAAREWYGPTEAFRFYGGPVDDDKGPEGRINAWPLDESYIDYVKGKAAGGIIANRKQPITKAAGDCDLF